MTKKQLALEVIDRLKKEYPDAECSLDYDEAWKLLVSVRLAAQCTDARVNVVVQDLYAKFPTIEALASAEVSEIEDIVRPCGLGKSKAKDISACMKMLHEKYNDKVPDDFDKRSPDNMILSVALKYKGENPIVLTSDNGLQLKSKALGLSTISLKSFLKR